nr:RNA-directed DNA polymerase, eukaryota [Tanacetum cinerariifolium]
MPDFIEDEEEEKDSEYGSIEEGLYYENVDKQEENGCNSKDPFNIYGLRNKEQKNLNDGPKSTDTMKYPPGFTLMTNANSQSNDLKGVGKEVDETLKNDQEEKQNSEENRFLTNGKVVIMGDFNEVRTPAERYGSIFNVQGVNAFNSFISST